MLYSYTLSEIRTNINTGVEYEIAMFYKLLDLRPSEQNQVMAAISSRGDVAKIKSIIAYTSTAPIYSALNTRGLTLDDVSFETQMILLDQQMWFFLLRINLVIKTE